MSEKNPSPTGDDILSAGQELLRLKEAKERKTGVQPIDRAVVLNDTVRPNSVELAVNAKGGVQPTVKVYHDNPMEAAKLALETLVFVKEQLGSKIAG